MFDYNCEECFHFIIPFPVLPRCKFGCAGFRRQHQQQPVTRGADTEASHTLRSTLEIKYKLCFAPIWIHYVFLQSWSGVECIFMMTTGDLSPNSCSQSVTPAFLHFHTLLGPSHFFWTWSSFNTLQLSAQVTVIVKNFQTQPWGREDVPTQGGCAAGRLWRWRLLFSIPWLLPRRLTLVIGWKAVHVQQVFLVIAYNDFDGGFLFRNRLNLLY